jgi:dTDP-4-amino-4,6-dideoxygalactose transaminase
MLSHHQTLRLDICPADLLSGLAGCLLPGRQPNLARCWPGPGEPLISLTLRSAFDLYLGALALPAGSEILISAVTHPEIVAIVRAHGLIPVPVDIVPATMAMQIPVLRRALRPETKAVLVTHLFGSRLDLADVAECCREHGLLLIEDCAQVFGGGYAGHPEAAASFFSFGPIKTATALGGAVTVVGDPAVGACMTAIQAAYPRQTRRTFAARVLKYAGVWALMRSGTLTGLASWLAGRRGRKLTDLVRLALRNVSGGFHLDRLRQQPAWPLLRLLERRLQRHTPERIAARREAGERLSQALKGLILPGDAGLDHLHWIFPVVVGDQAAVSDRLLEHGFHTLAGLSNLSAFDPPADRSDLMPKEAWRLTRQSLLVPMHGRLTPATVDRLAAVIRSAQSGCNLADGALATVPQP